MDVELLFRRALGYVLAVAVIVGLALLTVGRHGRALGGAAHDADRAAERGGGGARLLARQDAHPGGARPALLQGALQLEEDARAPVRGPERRPRPRAHRGAAARGHRRARSACARWRCCCPTPRATSSRSAATACRAPARAGRGSASGTPLLRVALGRAGRRHRPEPDDDTPQLVTSGLAWLFPCRVKGEVIAVLGVGRKDGLDPLNSEEVDTLKTLAAQAATAIMNGRLYQRLAEKADELRGLKDYNENILESLDSGIVVLDLEGRVVRWNRAMEGLYGRARAEVLGPAARQRLPRGVPRGAARLAGARRPRRDRARLQAAPARGRRPQPDGEPVGGALPVGARRALRHDPDPRRHHRAREARGAAAAHREDGLGGPARRRRRARGEYTARRDLVLHAAAARPARRAGPAPAGAREDREAELPRGQDHQRPAQLLALERHRVRPRRRQQGAGRRAGARRAPARRLAHPRAPRARRARCRRCAATRTASSRCSST